jgi:hypothetical protein
MIALAWLMLAAVTSKVELVNGDYQIAPSDWQWVPIGVKQRTGMLSADFQVRSSSGQVRLVLMRREDLDDMPRGNLAQTPLGSAGSINRYLHELGEYGLVIQNQDARAPANVHLNIWMDFAQPRSGVETLSPKRQFSVIAISFAVFFGIVTWSAKRLFQSMRGSGPPG